MFEEFLNFLQTAPINTFVAVTENWSDTDCKTSDKFLTATPTLFGKCRSDKKEASKGGEVGTFVPTEFKTSFESRIETVDENFFEYI